MNQFASVTVAANKMAKSLGVAACALLATNAVSVHAQQSPTARPNQELQADVESGESDHGHRPELGIQIGRCPGGGVCVHGTAPGSPAEQAGVRPGDYIMRVNGKQVNSPEEVARIVQSAADQSKVSLRIWSDGSEENVEVELARASDELPAHYRAWLGVVLQPAAKDGIEVSRVFPDSPADQAGLRDGDVIASIDGSSVDSVEAFIEKVGERAPGEEVKLVVERGDESRDIAVRLGDIERAPYPWLTSAFRQPRQSWELSEQLGETLGGMGNGVVLNALQELREDLASLRSEVAQLSGDREDRREQSGQDRDQKDQQPGFFEQRREERRSNRRGAEEDVDGLETRNFEPRGGTDPAHQIEIEQPDADRRDRENSEQERGVSQVEAADNESAVLGQRGRSSSRYYRDQWGNQNGNWSSRGRWNWQDGYDRWWSPGGSRSYNYNYPNYNNYYYRYGGVPYYYGGRPYSYGPRFGIRIGPSWGSYWY